MCFIFIEKVKKQNQIKVKNSSFNNYQIYFKNKLNIVIKANNIFCTFSKISNSKNKNIHLASTGMYKIKTTKKRIKYTYKKMISTFIRKIYYKLKTFSEKENESYNPFEYTILNIIAKKNFINL